MKMKSICALACQILTKYAVSNGRLCQMLTKYAVSAAWHAVCRLLDQQEQARPLLLT